MYKRHETGRDGEDIACDFLTRNNLEIIERNFRCKLGEIDIIAKDKDEIVFVEVKTRGQDNYGTPGEAVNKHKKNHIYHVAEYYMLIKKMESAFCRLDVIEVFIYDGTYKINYLKNSIQDRAKRKIYFDDEEQ